MIEITIKGHPKRVSKAKLRKAAHFFADKLMYTRLHENIYLEISCSTSDLDKTDKSVIEYGSCQPYYDAGESRPRIFDININPNMSESRTIETLAHEMVHLRQFAQGHLYEYVNRDDKKRLLYRWRQDKIDVTHILGWLLPWEIEAYGLQTALLNLFISFDQAKTEKEFKALKKINARKIRYGNTVSA